MRHGFAKRLVRAVKTWGLDVAGALAAIVYALPSLAYPFARDHPVHWYIGRQLLEGEMPYVSAVSTKPPAVFLVHALSLLLFGDHQWSIRVIDLAFVIANGVLIATFRPRRRMADGSGLEVPPRRPGEIGAACLLVACWHYTFFDFSDTGHPELWQGFFMLAPAWIIARAPAGRLSKPEAFGAGALACVAVMFKHPAVLSGVVAGLAVVGLALARREPKQAVIDAGLYTAGVAAVLALTLLPFWLTGTFGAFWELMVDFILNHYAPGDTPMRGAPPWLTYDHGLFAVVIALALLTTGLGVASASRDVRERRIGAWIALSLLVAGASVAIQRRALFSSTFTYYFVVLTPFLALAVAWGLRRVLSRRGGAQLAWAFVLTTALFLYAPKGTHNADWSYRAEWMGWIEILRGQRTREDQWRFYYNSALDAYVRQRRVAQDILERKGPGATLCMDGFTPILYHLTDTRCPSRFIVGDGAYAGPPQWRDEYETMLRENPPDFFVTFSDRPARIRQLERLGFVRHDVNDGRLPYYVVMERRRD